MIFLLKASIPPVNEFTEKEKLETVDPRNQDSWCIGTVIENDDRNDFWRLVDSTDIRYYGTTEKFVRKLLLDH
jgi:hypothetical protein